MTETSEMKPPESRYAIHLPPLRPGWRYERFEKILDIQGGSQPPKSTFVYEPTPGYVQLLQIRDFGERSVPTFVREDAVTKRCVEEDVLIARYGASLGRILTGLRGAYNVALAKVIFDRGDFCGKYLFYLLQTPFFQTPIHMISRSAQNGFNKGDLSDILLPVAPLDAQPKIVAEIEKQFTRLDAGVAALRRVRANLKRYRAAVLKAACEGRLVPTEAELARKERRTFETGEQLLQRILAGRHKNWNGRGKYKEPAPPDSVALPSLPVGWCWASIEQLSTRVQYGSSAKTSEDMDGVPVLRMGNIQDGQFDFQKLKYLPKAHDEFPELLLADGDLLFNRTNSAELVGKTAVFKGIPDPCSFASYLIRVRFAVGCVPDFVSCFINSVFGRAWIAEVVSQQVGQANVNGTKLQALTVPLPPIAEQTRVVAEIERRLSMVEALDRMVAGIFQRAAKLRQSTLQEALMASY